MAERYDPQSCADLQARIARMKAAHDDLVSGGKARVLVDQNGERIEFNAGNANLLLNHLRSLESEYANHCGLRPKAVSRPIRPYF